MPEPVPNATAVLVLGIISIVSCVLYAIPGIISLVLHRKDKNVYLFNPEKYDASFRTSKAGFVCGIIGLTLSTLYLIALVIAIMLMGYIKKLGDRHICVKFTEKDSCDLTPLSRDLNA